MTRIKTTDIKRQLRIRIATPEDAARLVAIYAPYVENTSITFEYIVPSAEEFADRIRHTLTRYPYLVAELDGEPGGYSDQMEDLESQDHVFPRLFLLLSQGRLQDQQVLPP